MMSSDNLSGYYLWLPIVLVLAVAPLFVESNYIIRFLTVMVMFAALGQAWNIVGGLGNQVSLGHAAFFGVGAYCTAILYQKFGLTPWAGMFVGAIAAAALAAIISYPTFRLRGPYFALATLAVAEVVQILAVHFRGLTGGAMGIYIPFRGESFLNMQFKSLTPYYYIMLCVLVVVTIAFVVIERSSLGLKLRALRHDELAASSAGVNVFQSKFIASLVSAMFAAVVGSVYAFFQAFIDPPSVFGLVSISVMLAMVTIIGGLGHVAGPLIGALIVMPTQEIMLRVAGANPGYSMLFFGVLLIVVILAFPNGVVSLLGRLRKPGRQAQPQA